MIMFGLPCPGILGLSSNVAKLMDRLVLNALVKRFGFRMLIGIVEHIDLFRYIERHKVDCSDRDRSDRQTPVISAGEERECIPGNHRSALCS